MSKEHLWRRSYFQKVKNKSQIQFTRAEIRSSASVTRKQRRQGTGGEDRQGTSGDLTQGAWTRVHFVPRAPLVEC